MFCDVYVKTTDVPAGMQGPRPIPEPTIVEGQSPRSSGKREGPHSAGSPESHAPPKGSLQARTLERPEPRFTIPRHQLLLLAELLEHAVLVCGNHEIPHVTAQN